MTLICFDHVCSFAVCTYQNGVGVLFPYSFLMEAFGDACFSMNSRQVLTPFLFLLILTAELRGLIGFTVK